MKFDTISFEKLTPHCRGKVFYEDVLDSTSDEARRDVIAGKAESGNIYLAEYQTKGRGRGGNKWVCPDGEGLLFSLVLDPDAEQKFWSRMSLAVGLAIVDACKDLGLMAELKWPNDIYVNNRKLGGILIENVDGLLIVGVGLNVNVKEFSDEVSEKATSALYELDEQTHGEINREQLLSTIVHLIFQNGSMIDLGFHLLLERIRGCFYLTGKHVSMTVNEKEMIAEVQGISDDGYLLVDDHGVNLQLIQASKIAVLHG